MGVPKIPLYPDVAIQPPNFGVAETYSWVGFRDVNLPRPLYARASYITNLSDLTLSLCASDIRIGGVEIVDNESELRCDVTTFVYEDGHYNALRVVTQDLEPTYDTVSLADINYNYVTVVPETSSLNVNVTNFYLITSQLADEFNTTRILLTNEFNETQTLLNSLTSLQENKQNQIITLLHQLTANTDEIEVNLDNLEINTDEVEELILHTNTELAFLTALNVQNNLQTASLTALNAQGNLQTASLTAFNRQGNLQTASLTALNVQGNLQTASLTALNVQGNLQTASLTALNVQNNLQTASLTALNVQGNLQTASLTAITQKEFDDTQTLLVLLTSQQENKQNQIITLLHQLTANTDEIEVNLDNLEINTDGVESLISNSNSRLDALTSVDYATASRQDSIITLLDALTSKQTSISIETSALNLNTDELEYLVTNTNTLIYQLTTDTAQLNSSVNTTNTLLNNLTAKTLDVEIIIDSVEPLLSSTNTLLIKLTSEASQANTYLQTLTATTFDIVTTSNISNTFLENLTGHAYTNNLLTAFLTAVKFATEPKQDTANTLLQVLTTVSYTAIQNQNLAISLLDALTAREYEFTVNAQNINLNVDDIEELIQTTNTLVNKLTTLNASVLTNQNTQITLEHTLTSNSVYGTLSSQPLFVVPTATLTTNVITTGDGLKVSFADTANLDAFGRLRVSNPLTLFDSSHRYRDNNLWSTLTAVGGTCSFNQNQGLIDMTVTSASGSSVIRETTKVFSYQPGKSLLVMNTFAMAPSAINLRQRVGYFGQDNGIYFQLQDDKLSFVERTLVNGTPSVETVIPLSSCNGDRLDGHGPSGLTIDITKAQILWMDIEWLGLGTVRAGFIINGKFIICHSFHHANILPTTYITTASLPLRYEITNLDTVPTSKTLKQVCSTVISEGGYELRGLQQAIGIPITTPRTFAATNTYYPIISIRLKVTPDRLDAIVILTALSIMTIGNGINYNWQVRASGTTNGGTWNSAGIDSAVEYNITGTSYTEGRILANGFLNSSNQGSPNLDILKEALFKFQLERNNLTKTPYELTLLAATDTSNGSGIFASMDWEEISR